MLIVKPYISEFTLDIQYVEVTEELKAQNRKFAQQALGKSILDGAFEAFRTPPIHWNEENLLDITKVHHLIYITLIKF
ncbi:hypothetical protein [Mycoplasmopsis cynos]|uniref:hypothetical protein n=1 Tax=Mycoplasmopsis cynos TaxID=171284 RepID=UPI0021FF7048|nr:hypothetical protein [Mycoplasmopsis cynos]UWV77669.1 hypothetical protein NW070_01975 [Mycoplasmopsis cynos]